MIPGASKITSMKSPAPNSICGQGVGLVTATIGTVSTTVCSKALAHHSSLINTGTGVANFNYSIICMKTSSGIFVTDGFQALSRFHPGYSAQYTAP